jgi:uncharacterized membrane protein
MYKVRIKLENPNRAGNSLSDLKKVGLIPVFFTVSGDYELYEAVAPFKSVSDVKEALVDLAYLASKKGKRSDSKYAIIYEVKNLDLGIALGATLGALGGFAVGKILGGVLGALGGAVAGAIASSLLGEQPVEVVQWPIAVNS